MSRLDCVRESLRLALQELEGLTPAEDRPVFWRALWERYVESQADYRSSVETLGRKLGEAGADVWQLLEWLRGAGSAQWTKGPQVQLLRRVFGEQFETVAGQSAPVAREKESVVVDAAVAPGSDPPTQAEVQALRDKCEELADDVRALATLVHSLRTALVAEGLIKGST